jgi:type I restriction enzyme S subunit
MGSETVSFGECARLIRDSVDPDQIDPETPYIGLQHIAQDELRLLEVGKASDVSSNKYEFKKGDILFGKLRPYFRKVILAPFDGVCSTDIWVVRATEKCEQNFLFYWMASQEFVDKANQGSEGTKMPRAKWDFVSKITKEIPDLQEQKRISGFLKAFDDKTELNQRMNETLEAIARAIFKSWFVDFDPVKAKMVGEPYPLPDAVMALFPDELVESELGMIPKGWAVGKLGDEFKVVMGQSPPGSSYNEEGKGIAFYQGRTDFGFRYPSERVYCTEPKRFAEPGDTLVSVRAPVGDVNMAKEKCCIGRGVAAIRHKSDSSSYTYYSMLDLQRRFKVFEAEGTVFGSIGKRDFNNLLILFPNKIILTFFNHFVSSIDKKIENNFFETNDSKELKNELTNYFFN